MSKSSSSPAGLPRHFGFWTGWFVVVASMIGSGILTNSGPIMKATGSYSSLLLLWTVGGFLALAGALTMGELASGITRAGGDYAYVYEAFGPACGFTYGWAMVLLGFAAPIAVVAFTTASFLQPILHSAGADGGLSPATLVPSLATFIILVLTLAHCFGQRGSSLVQASTTIFKLAVLLGFAVPGLLSASADLGGHWREATPLAAVRAPSLATGLILVMYAYTGWNGASYLGGETRDAERLVPRCLALGTLAVTGVYLLVNLFYVAALAPSAFASLGDTEISRLAPIAIGKVLGDRTAKVFSLLFSVEVFASLSAYILTGPRIVYAMAHDGLCPRVLGKLHARSRSPVLATLGQSAAALVFLWSGTFEQILEFTSYGLATISVLVVAPIFVLRRRPGFRPTFRVPGYPWTPLFFVVSSVVLIAGGAVDKPFLALASLASIGAGFPLYLAWQRLGRTSRG